MNYHMNPLIKKNILTTIKKQTNKQTLIVKLIKIKEKNNKKKKTLKRLKYVEILYMCICICPKIISICSLGIYNNTINSLLHRSCHCVLTIRRNVLKNGSKKESQQGSSRPSTFRPHPLRMKETRSHWDDRHVFP